MESTHRIKRGIVREVERKVVCPWRAGSQSKDSPFPVLDLRFFFEKPGFDTRSLLVFQKNFSCMRCARRVVVGADILAFGDGCHPPLGPYSHGDLRRQRLITSPSNEKVHKDARRCIVVVDSRPSRVPPAVCVEGGECCTFHFFVTVAIECVLRIGKSRRLKNAHAPLPWGKTKRLPMARSRPSQTHRSAFLCLLTSSRWLVVVAGDVFPLVWF